MTRTTLITLLAAGLATQAAPAAAQESRSALDDGGGLQRAPAPAAVPLFPQPSPPLTGVLRFGSFASPVPRTEPLPAFPGLQEQEEEDPDRELKKYVGVGLMVVGGINTLYGLNCVATPHAWGNACWPYLGVSVGMGIGGWVLYRRNR